MTIEEWKCRETDVGKEGWVVVEVEGMKNSATGFPYVVLDPQTARLLADFIESIRPKTNSNRVFVNKAGESINDGTLYYWTNILYEKFKFESQVHFSKPMLPTYQFNTQRRAINTWSRGKTVAGKPPQGLLNQALVQLEETGEAVYTLTTALSDALGVAKWTHGVMAHEINPKEKLQRFAPVATKPVTL